MGSIMITTYLVNKRVITIVSNAYIFFRKIYDAAFTVYIPKISFPNNYCFIPRFYIICRVRHKYSNLFSFRIKLNPYTSKTTRFESLSWTIAMSFSLFWIPLKIEFDVATLYILLSQTQNLV